jgi:hypothetical protein
MGELWEVISRLPPVYGETCTIRAGLFFLTA